MTPRRTLPAVAAAGVLLLAVSLLTLSQAAPAGAAIIAATCNNTVTDDATIQGAINSSAAGDEIVIDGPCLIDATVKLLGERAYRGGAIRPSTIKQASGANLPAMFASDSWADNSPTTGNPVTIRDLSFDGNDAANTGATSCLIIRSWLTTIERVNTTACEASGIKVTSKSANGSTLTNAQVNGRIVNCMIEDSGSHGIHVEDPVNSVTDWTLKDNWLAHAGGDAIRLENAAGWQVDGNHTYGAFRNAIYADRLYGTSISGNYIEDFGEGGPTGTYAGVNAWLQGDADSVIAGNKIINSEQVNTSTYRYISVQGNYGTGVASVTGNAIRGPNGSKGTGLWYGKGGATALTLASTGNAVASVQTVKTVGTGVTVTAGS